MNGSTMVSAITIRHPEFDLSELPRDWLGGNRLATHFGNAGHVFIPLGEQFFIDTVKQFRDRIDDDAQRRDVKAFIGQEAVHKRAHEQMWDLLRDRGVPIDGYAQVIAAVRSVERFVPARLRLSVTAALEHYTAVFGYSFLTEDLATAVPDEMARLLAWHGLEELEHRAVAFDVLLTVDDGYLLRVAGFAVATGLLVVVPLTGTAMFAVADRRRPVRGGKAVGSGLQTMSARFLRRMSSHLVDYLRPGFHPGDLTMPPQAAAWVAKSDAQPTRRATASAVASPERTAPSM